MSDWDSATYDALPLPHDAWGRRTLLRLAPPEDAHVLDAGCGTGRDTELLLGALPRGRVIAVDRSPAMLARCRARLAAASDRLEVIEADVERPLPVRGRVDAVFSVACFHWIHDHAALFANLARVLRPGGRLVAECGGAGQLAAVMAAVEAVPGAPRVVLPYFADADTTRTRLLAAGFTHAEAWLRPAPARIDDRATLECFLAAIVLRPHLDALGEADRPRFIAAVVDRMAEPVVDYIRLEIEATAG